MGSKTAGAVLLADPSHRPTLPKPVAVAYYAGEFACLCVRLSLRERKKKRERVIEMYPVPYFLSFC